MVAAAVVVAGEVAAAVAEACPGTTVTVNPDALPDKRSYRVDFSRFRELAPGHQPRVTLVDSVARLMEGLRAIGFNDPNFRESQRIRLHVLAKLGAEGLVDDALRWMPS